MPKIQFTNIIVDDFLISKKQTDRRYIHILTHIHTDHLKGLCDGWDYGKIYCTNITKKLLERKFPNITCITALEEEKTYSIPMSPHLSLNVTLFNANHCLGAVMLLIEGYIGTILYSGDIRYERNIFQKYSALYPLAIQSQHSNQPNLESFHQVSKQIDILYLDNTFMKKKFNFPPRDQALLYLDEFIDKLAKNQYNKSFLYIGMDNYGKEEVLIHIAQKYQILIIVDAVRYSNLQAMEVNLQYFTTVRDQGSIEVVSKHSLKKYVDENEDSMGLILTGWVNEPKFKHNNKIFCVPYSLHSNYNEIEEFVCSIRPSLIYPIVQSTTEKSVIKSKEYVDIEMNNLHQINYDDQLKDIRIRYCSKKTEQYQEFTSNIPLQKVLLKQLQMEKPLEIKCNIKGMTTVGMQQNVQRKKYRFSDQRNETEIKRMRNKIDLMKINIRGDNEQVVDLFTQSLEEKELHYDLEDRGSHQQADQDKQYQQEHQPLKQKSQLQFKQLQQPHHFNQNQCLLSAQQPIGQLIISAIPMDQEKYVEKVIDHRYEQSENYNQSNLELQEFQFEKEVVQVDPLNTPFIRKPKNVSLDFIVAISPEQKPFVQDHQIEFLQNQKQIVAQVIKKRKVINKVKHAKRQQENRVTKLMATKMDEIIILDQSNEEQFINKHYTNIQSKIDDYFKKTNKKAAVDVKNYQQKQNQISELINVDDLEEKLD